MEDLKNKLDTYLRLLYSEKYSGEVEAQLANGQMPFGFISSINFSRLSVERNYRVWDLKQYMARHCGPLFSRLSSDEVFSLCNAYCSSEAFWEMKGRTLTENFCLFVANYFNEIERVPEKEMAELLGSVSGLSESRGDKSPWQGHDVIYDKDKRCSIERFHAFTDLLDAEGNVVLGALNGNDAGFEISIENYDDRSSLVKNRRL